LAEPNVRVVVTGSGRANDSYRLLVDKKREGVVLADRLLEFLKTVLAEIEAEGNV